MVFTLFKLPILCLECCLKNMDSLDLLFLSFTSRKLLNLIRRTRTSVIRFGVECDSAGYRTVVTIVRRGGVENGKWTFNLPFSVPGIKKWIKGWEFMFWRNPNNSIQSYTTVSHIHEELNLGLAYLMYLFKCKTLRVSITGLTTIDNGKLKFLIENFRIAERFEINAPMHSTFQCDPEIFQSKELVMGGEWITRDILFGLKCSCIFLKNCHILQMKDFEAFIRRWFNSTDTEFRQLAMVVDLPRNRFNLKRQKLMKWDPEMRSRYYPFNETEALDCENGKDCVRNDGLLATVLKKQKMLIFVVWHDRHPDVTGLQIV
ncbi:hypothetical protein GCK72_011340 [Caenorhabditis remanei]|uniref:F-box domain-containing protein n=1 Tax=Caenorhabditis remanei TaxID=31234 RepID=A0A6A5H7I0_CAERE|nr:hypothetical protein GCK72_011340 [Caenorhabditis remanei]KAF1763075.1 hypothetical protein GCK72_011340 [Caenorhabditis remanei]